MVEAQVWLNINYPLHERGDHTSLEINSKRLEGSLKLEKFTNLEKIDCSFNKLTELQIINSPRLKQIRCSYNDLTRLNFNNSPKLKILICNDNYLDSLNLNNNQELEELNILDNNFYRQDLSFLKHLVNLKVLKLGSWMKNRMNKGLYNRLQGSLEDLKNMNELERLDIRNTDIDSGLRYLPNSVEFLCCLADPERSNAGVGKIFDDLNKQEEIELYGDRDDDEPRNNDCIRDFRRILQNYKKKFGIEDNKDKEVEELKLRLKNFELMLSSKVGPKTATKWIAEVSVDNKR